MKEGENEDGDEESKDMDVKRVIGGSKEGIDLQVLLDGLEEQFDLPALTVDFGDGGGRQIEPIGEEDILLALIIDELDPAKPDRFLVYFVMFGSDRDDLVANDPAAVRSQSFGHLVEAVFLHPGDEADLEQRQLGEPEVVVVPPIEHHDRARWKVQPASHFDVRGLPVGDHGVPWQVPVVVE